MVQFYDPVTSALAVLRVVQSGDFRITEFQATDWELYGAAQTVVTTPVPPVFVLPVIRVQIIFAAAVDDDVRLTVGGVVITDPRRNLGWYSSPPHPALDYTVGKNGDWVQIDCFDGWGANYQTSAWTAHVYLDGVLQQTVTGGVTSGALTDGASTPPGGYNSAYWAAPPILFNYYSMGGFTINVV